MTCVIGLVDKGKVWMGADSMSANESFNSETCAYPKIAKIDKCLIGYTTSWRMGQLLAHSLKLPVVGRKDLLTYMTTNFVNSVIDVLKKGKWLTEQNSQIEGGTFLIGIKGRLFRVQEDFSVLELSCGYDAIGCGHDIAKGAMYAGKNIKDPSKRIITALEAAEEFSSGVRRPFYIHKV